LPRRLVSALAFLLASAAVAHAADAPPGALSCSGCHGTSSSLRTSIPTLSGRGAAEIAAMMGEFKSGARPATVMGRIAKGFGDTDIDAMAEWLATQGK
jgi:cytochrome subunit of sulfide dehydrogenase